MRALLVGIVILGLTSPVNADCMGSPGKVLLARPVRCESSEPYLFAACTAADPSDSSSGREERCRSMAGAGPQWSGNVIVVWGVSQVELDWGIDGEGTRPYTAPNDWKPVLEPGRYWWSGTLDECRALERGAFLRFRITQPCCDTIPAFNTPCYSGLFIAQPISANLEADLPDKARKPLRLDNDPLLQFFTLDRDPEADQSGKVKPSGAPDGRTGACTFRAMPAAEGVLWRMSPRLKQLESGTYQQGGKTCVNQ